LYRASTRLEVSQVPTNVTDIDPLENDSSVSERQYLNTQYELLVSRFMARRVVQAGNLTRNSAFLAAFEIDEASAADSGSIERLLLDNITVEPVIQSSLVDVHFVSPSPEVSATVANLWAEEFISANFEKRFGQNIEAREFLNGQIEELREALAQSEEALVNYAQSNEILVLDAGETGSRARNGQTLIASDLTALNAALAEAIADRIAAQASASSGEFPQNDPRNQLRATLVEEEAALAELRANFGPRYPALVQKEAVVRSLRDSIQTEGMAALTAAQTRENQLRAQVEQVKARFITEQGRGIQYGILKRDVDTNRQLYDGLLQRVKELEASGAGQNNIKLIDAAEVPKRPYSPSLLLNVLMSLVIGVLLCALLVYLRATISQNVRDPADVQKRLGLPRLGSITLYEAKSPVDDLATRSSELSEAYQSARTNVTFLTSSGAPKVLMLTSSVPAEGKSMSAVALATSFAKLGQKTLLIDATCAIRGC
ncbi:MAG: GNVR domain-containing protein, partial [Pseudomonadota bacterium]